MTPEARALALRSALGLGGIDGTYDTKGTIPPVYLLDAAAELGLAATWDATAPPVTCPDLTFST